MKNLKFSLFFFLIAVSISIMIGCSKKTDNPTGPPDIIKAEASLTFNGAGYTNQKVTLSNGLCAFSTTDNLTIVQFSGTAGSDSLLFLFQFVGNQTGAHAWRSSDYDALIYKHGGSGAYAFWADSVGTTTVSGFGAVNSKVEGNISGKLIEATSQAELNITGSFSAIRLPDDTQW